jgi:hypothetical protein
MCLAEEKTRSREGKQFWQCVWGRVRASVGKTTPRGSQGPSTGPYSIPSRSIGKSELLSPLLAALLHLAWQGPGAEVLGRLRGCFITQI